MRRYFITEWQKYPFIGILLPLIAGILFAEYIHPPSFSWIIYPSLCVSFLALTFLVNYTSYHLRFLFGVVLYCFLFLSGISLTTLKSKSLIADFPSRSGLYTAVLMTNGAAKNTSVQCEAYIPSYDDGLRKQDCRKSVILSFQKNAKNRKLKAGDVIYYYGIMQIPKPNRNPGSFNYADYLRYQGISGTAYIPDYTWWRDSLSSKISVVEDLPLSVRMILRFRKLRNYLLTPYSTKSGDEEIVSVLSALTLGDVSGLPQQLKSDYSVAGVSHILALSGSHMAVLYAILELFFSAFLYRWRAGRLIGKITIVLFLWNFVFLAGCQPSIIRAAIMYTLLVCASFFSRKALSLNSLAAAAFFMLVVDPYSLFDVGFQLSFLAVLGILFFNGILYKRFQTPYKPVNYAVSILTVSLAVQLVSFPLLMYYFSSFPLYFLFANLLVVPVSSIVLLIALPGFLLQFITGGWWLTEWMIKGLFFLVSLQNEGVKWIASLPYSSLYVPGISSFGTIWMYVMLSFFLWKKYVKALMRKYVGLTLLFLGFCGFLYQQLRSATDDYIVFYDNRRCPAVHLVKHARKGLLFPAWKDSLTTGMAHIESSFWKPEGISYPNVVTPEDHILQLDACNILLLKDFYWAEHRLKTRLKIDYVWICRGYYGKLSAALSSFSVGLVILDASLSDKYRNFYRQECAIAGIPFHDMAEGGAYKAAL